MTDIEKPSKGGRPSSYKEEYAQQAKKLARLGLTDKEMADLFDVALSTFHKWKLDYPEFSDSLKEGKELSDANVTAALYDKAVGYEKNDKYYPPDTTACIFWLKNRQPEKWRDKAEPQDSSNMVDVLKALVDKLPS